MPCTECGSAKTSELSLAEETSNMTLSEGKGSECGCSAKAPQKSSSSNSSCRSTSRPTRGCFCCCGSCCACCRCCSRSSRDFSQDRINEAKAEGCSCCARKREEVVKPSACGCKH